MKIVATEQEIVDAIKSEFMKQEIDLEGWSINAILEALKSLPTLKDELEAIKSHYFGKGDFVSSGQINLAIDVVCDYEFNK